MLVWLWESCWYPQGPPGPYWYVASGLFWTFSSLSCSKMRLQRVEGSWPLQEETLGARKGHGERVL